MLTHRRLLTLLLALLFLVAGMPALILRAADEPSPAAGGGALPEEKVLFLTFDDGPSPYTAQILEILGEYDAKATFFVIGRQATEEPETIAALYAAGHALGNHSWSHFSLIGVSRWAFDAELEDTGALFGEMNGWCLRPPYGAMDDTVVARAAELGYETVKWTIDPQDWRQAGARVIAQHVIDNAVHNGIVLLHDGGGDRSQTVAALPILLRRLSAEGWQFKALCRDVRPSELATATEAELPAPPLSEKPEVEAVATPYSEEYPDGMPEAAPSAEAAPAPSSAANIQRAPRAPKPGRAVSPTPAATPTLQPTSTPDLVRRGPRVTATPLPTPVPTVLPTELPAELANVAIAFPSDGARVRGVLLVQGIASHQDFREWRLDLLAEGEEPRFLALGETALNRSGPLVSWDTRRYPNGPYTLRLRVLLDSGDFVEAESAVVVDNP